MFDPQIKAYLSFEVLCLVRYRLVRVSVSEPSEGMLLRDTLSQGSQSLPPLWESAATGTSIFTVCLSHCWWDIRYTSLDGLHYFHSLHSLIQQTSILHPLCAKQFREAMRIKLTLTSKKVNVQMTHTQRELSLWYMLDMRKCLQRVTKTGDWYTPGERFPWNHDS